MISNERRAALTEAKRQIMRERKRSNVTMQDMADAIGLSLRSVEVMLDTGSDHKHLRYADMIMLAAHPVTRELVRLLVAPLLEVVDSQQLRVVDLQGMANDKLTADYARMILRPTVDKLWPANATQNEVPKREESST